MAQLSQIPSLLNDANLVAYYKLEDLNDSKGGYTLINFNSTAFNPGLYGLAADFGTTIANKKLQNNGFPVAGNAAISISCWVKLQTEISSGTFDFVQHQSTSGSSRNFGITYQYNGGTRRLGVYNSTTPGSWYFTSLGTSNWYHMVATRASGTLTADFWLNGVQQVSGVAQGGDTASGTILSIGCNPGNTTFATALVDDVAIFSKVLSSAEISMLYSKTSGGSFIYNLL